jgi:hypothetical protein
MAILEQEEREKMMQQRIEELETNEQDYVVSMNDVQEVVNRMGDP